MVFYQRSMASKRLESKRYRPDDAIYRFDFVRQPGMTLPTE